MVRLRRLRLLRKRDRPPVLPAIEPNGATTARLRRVRGGVLRAPDRKPRARQGRRSNRPPLAPDAVDSADRRLHPADRPAPALCINWGPRARTTGYVAIDPRFFRGWRVHRLDGVHDRAGARFLAWPHQQLDGRRHNAWVHPRLLLSRACPRSPQPG